jgi:hypothetical protein
MNLLSLNTLSILLICALTACATDTPFVDPSVQGISRDQIAVLTTDRENGQYSGVRITGVFDYKKQVELLGDGNSQAYAVMDIPPGDYGIKTVCPLGNLVSFPQLHVIVKAGEIHHIKCMMKTTYSYLVDDVDKVPRKGDPNIFFRVISINEGSGTLRLKIWHPALYRFSTEDITVFKSDNEDSATALIEKMRDLLHREKQEEFVLESRRLGKLIALDAKPEHDLATSQLLREEFSFEARSSK